MNILQTSGYRNIMVLTKDPTLLLITTLMFVSLNVLFLSSDINAQSVEKISLYDSNDDVIELEDKSINDIVQSGKIWIVEFYAHWCGHCQRFAPKWKKVADKFKVWNKWLNIAAINCAQQDCREFSILGTPTVRAFGPTYLGINNSETENTGKNIPARHEEEYWYETILSIIEDFQEEELEKKKKSDAYSTLMDRGLHRLNPIRNEESISKLFSTNELISPSRMENCNNEKYLVAILESNGYHGIGRSDEDGKISRLAVLEYHTIFPNLKVNRVLPNDTEQFLDDLNLFNEIEMINKDYAVDLSNSAKRPGVLIYTISSDKMSGNCVHTYHYHPFPVYNITLPEEASYEIVYKLLNEFQMNMINNMTEWIENDAQMKEAYHTTELPETTTKGKMIDADPEDQIDLAVSIDDIERAIRKSLVDEVSRHSTLTNEKMLTLYQWIAALMKYLPLRRVVYDFLKELRQELNQKMRAQNYTEMAGEEYVEILDGLLEKHQPFNETSSSWVGCLGSDPKYRGYPCSLWQTFHTITVGALLADEFDMNEGVSKTIYDYVHHFFTCRHCAEHFAQEVAKSSSSSHNTTTLPMWPSDTVFWMWRLHNMANLRLKGDLTEDPEHPKIFWPSEENCPRCYNWKTKRSVDVDTGLALLIKGDLKNGTSITHMVNKMEVVNYLKKIYGPKTSEREQKSLKDPESLTNVIESLLDTVEEIAASNDTSITSNFTEEIKSTLNNYCQEMSSTENDLYHFKLFEL